MAGPRDVRRTANAMNSMIGSKMISAISAIARLSAVRNRSEASLGVVTAGLITFSAAEGRGANAVFKLPATTRIEGLLLRAPDMYRFLKRRDTP
jgi:hypothetical protein